MITRIANYLTNTLHAKKIILEDDREIYEYGLWVLITYTANIVTMLIIGSLMGLFKESLIFSITFISMRHNNGGFHANNDLTCYFLGTVSTLASFCSIKWVLSSGIESIKIFLAALPFIAVVLFLTPVEDSNKPLDNLERVVYKKRGIVTLAISVAVASCLMMLQLTSLGCAIIGAVILTGITMVIGHCNNLILERKMFK